MSDFLVDTVFPVVVTIILLVALVAVSVLTLNLISSMNVQDTCWSLGYVDGVTYDKEKYCVVDVDGYKYACSLEDALVNKCGEGE